MNVERKYKKDSKHKYWKIVLKRLYSTWFDDNTIILEAYGFSSKNEYKSGFYKINYGYSYIGSTKEEVIKQEDDLIRFYYDDMKKKITDINFEISELELKKAKLKERMNCKLFTQLYREEKLERILNE